MKIQLRLFPLLLVIIPLIFFYKSILYGQIPFPGDLLVGNYEPYKSQTNAGFIPGSVPHKAQGPDVIKEIIPWKKFSIDSFKSGQIPFWNPYNFAGNPLLANFQSAVFFPANIVYLFLDFNRAWSLYIYLIPVLSASFTYLFLRRLNLSRQASVFGGIVFAFSSYMTVWLEYGNIGYTFVFLPLILYSVDCLIEKITLRNFAGLVLASFMALIAGYIQGVFYIYLITSFYFLIKIGWIKKTNLHKYLIVGAGLIIPLLLAAFQLLPTLGLFGQSSRGNYSLDQIKAMLNPIYYLITVAVPDFFGNPAARNYWIGGTYIERVSYFGLIPFALALFAIISIYKKVEVKIFAILFFVSIILATDFFITRFFYLIPIPVISTTVATRILSIATFSGSILSAFGLDALIARKSSKKLFYCAFFLLVLLFGLLGFTVIYPIAFSQIEPASLKIAQRNLIIPIISFVVFIISVVAYIRFERLKLIKKFGKGILVTLIFVISFADLFYYFHKITPFAKGEFMYPSTPVVSYLKTQQKIDRSWGYGAAAVESNFQTYEGIYSTEGNDPLHVKSYTELVAASGNGRVPEVLPRPDANIAPGYGKEELANNPFRQKALNIVGVKYVLNKDESISGDYNPDYTTFPQNLYNLIWQKGFWQVYENKASVPRVFITDKYITENNSKKSLRKIYSDNFNEHNQLLLNEDPKVKSGNLTSSSKLILYTPEKVVIQTKATKSALLFLSDTYYPEWKATIDGKLTKIYLADYAFRAVVIPAGSHEVIFEYVPTAFYKGLIIGIFGIVALVIVSVYIVNRKSK